MKFIEWIKNIFIKKRYKNGGSGTINLKYNVKRPPTHIQIHMNGGGGGGSGIEDKEKNYEQAKKFTTEKDYNTPPNLEITDIKIRIFGSGGGNKDEKRDINDI